MDSQDTSQSQKTHQSKYVEREKLRHERRLEREKLRHERKLEREKRGGRTSGTEFADNVIDVISEGVHNLVEDILHVVQERQAKNRGEGQVADTKA